MADDEELPLEEKISRLRLPKENEVFGLVEKTLGSNHLKVKCKDGRTRTCRIPGRMRKRVWIREGDLVIVEPWEVQSDERGDIMHRYTRTQVGWLSKKGLWEES